MPDLLYEKHDHHAVFTMNRPERLNALGSNLWRELREAIDDFTADDQMRVGILTGAGRAFSAGADLKEANERNQRGEAGRHRPLEESALFSRCSKPLIAAVNGLCLAGGMERALDCDVRICSTEAYFGLFEVKRGILPGYGIHHLARLVPFGEAMYILLTADRISAPEAHRIGLVHEVVEPQELMPRAEAIAGMIADNAPLAVEGAKAVAHHWRQLAIDESYRMGSWVSRVVLSSEDAKEGPRAFVEKRAPRWKGK